MPRVTVRRAGRRGAVIVETALVASVFLVLYVFGLFEYARFVMTRQLLDHAAREGARYAVVHTYDKAKSDVQAVVLAAMAGGDKQLQNVAVDVFQADPDTGGGLGAWTGAKFGQAVAVQVTGTYSPVLPVPLLMPDAVPMKAVVVMYSEAN